MSSIHRLQIVLRVPVTVEEDDGIGSDEVDPDSSGTSREEKDVRGCA
jgi:hypothetical protein